VAFRRPSVRAASSEATGAQNNPVTLPCARRPPFARAGCVRVSPSPRSGSRAERAPCCACHTGSRTEPLAARRVIELRAVPYRFNSLVPGPPDFVSRTRVPSPRRPANRPMLTSVLHHCCDPCRASRTAPGVNPSTRLPPSPLQPGHRRPGTNRHHDISTPGACLFSSAAHARYPRAASAFEPRTGEPPAASPA